VQLASQTRDGWAVRDRREPVVVAIDCASGNYDYRDDASVAVIISDCN
jgi:hypothetical protein